MEWLGVVHKREKGASDDASDDDPPERRLAPHERLQLRKLKYAEIVRRRQNGGESPVRPELRFETVTYANLDDGSSRPQIVPSVVAHETTPVARRVVQRVSKKKRVVDPPPPAEKKRPSERVAANARLQKSLTRRRWIAILRERSRAEAYKVARAQRAKLDVLEWESRWPERRDAERDRRRMRAAELEARDQRQRAWCRVSAAARATARLASRTRRARRAAAAAAIRCAASSTIQRAWRGYFARQLAPKLLAMHRVAGPLRRAVRRRRRRRARALLRRFCADHASGHARVVSRYLACVRRAQRAATGMVACCRARREALLRLCRRVEREQRREIARAAVEARRDKLRAQSHHPTKKKPPPATKKKKMKKNATTTTTTTFTKRQIEVHDRQLRCASATFARLDAIWAIRAVQEHDATVLPSAEDVCRQQAAITDVDGALLVALDARELERAIETHLVLKRKAHVRRVDAHRAANRKDVTSAAARALLSVGGEKQINNPLSCFLRLYTDDTLGPESWNSLVRGLVLEDLRARREHVAQRLSSTPTSEAINRLAAQVMGTGLDSLGLRRRSNFTTKW